LKTKKIELWTTKDAYSSDEKLGLPPLGKVVGNMEIDMTILSDNLKNVLSDFQNIVDETPQSSSGYNIDEIEISLGINAKGGITLIGKLEAGVQAGIKVKIKRTQ